MKIEDQEMLLALLGYYTLRKKNGDIAIDNLPGPALISAIRHFQEDSCMPVTGTCDAKTFQAMKHALVYGMPEVDPPPDVPDWEDPPEATDSVWDEPDVKPYFDRSEFMCPCPRCGGFPVEPHPDLVRACAHLRKRAVAKIPTSCFKISSGVRCQAHNDELPGSVPDSRHVRGRAVDFTCPGFTANEIYLMAKDTPGIVYTYIMPSGWVHMDIGN